MDKLSKPERAVCHAFPRSELVDLAAAIGSARTIHAEVISALLLGAVPSEPGCIAAVGLDGARIHLNVKHGAIRQSVRGL
jgi:hypothetical protein